MPDQRNKLHIHVYENYLYWYTMNTKLNILSLTCCGMRVCTACIMRRTIAGERVRQIGLTVA